MNFRKILAELDCDASYDIEIKGIHNDSRMIKPGYLFVAYPGAEADGRLFIAQAISRGARAILYEAKAPIANAFHSNQDVPCIPVSDLAEKLGRIAKIFYGNPSRSLNITGITGTNGKTTIAYQLAHAFERLNRKAAYIGTLGEGRPFALHPLNNTTPDALCLHQLLKSYKDLNIEQICMEVSSHALSLKRTEGIEFSHAIYTNLSHEHLDFHRTMEAYAFAKAKLFAVPSLQSALINLDDEYAPMMIGQLPAGCKKLTYGLRKGCDVYAQSFHTTMTGSILDIVSPWGKCEIKTAMLGEFNLYNALAIFSHLLLNGGALQDVIAVMATLRAVPGRMEVVADSPCVIVDYAHTPDALENVLLTLRKLKQNRLIVVFGCGGDRDKGKRPMMGRIASDYADEVIVTSDNPRSENPSSIIEEIIAGINAETKPKIVVDRAEAIETALNIAVTGDIILIAGKGHESYQQIGKKRIHFSDQHVVQRLLYGS
ncbi:UDP-N-acetylmuramoyl-L-alanyl-D-glutamate--2,6-diaminopimelate ligase [Legionella londiniensis]|uniref:UDP-N-acetylmuramoyl-L-alanyl-D-glutamate--2,6-diaminopimelate ligase n=1 Tax=Legionella londiniensis TaxID=45068 RepID=A0A0W0VQJ5_9GAMM|nr:UDP-N-acetylmuramoyl-L-alanyl-D-glutamate--2,6-diaminopimelate ligase [Legionella londiniensis]KTD22443.1 UDP-N-acetylmuramoylalanyl-D-glutamate-2, 6-diaminopimelate ligase [Legionella londiniensis]STX92984.1 UDP-N-acetylmuramoylalanyl-D-glutamate-2, 6-diaminopimelate ligase [Legionella londiniensis]